ncbi:MAG: helix-turn-helix domain-containing protein [Dehalococcoidales bacterium]|nr:helix-turn-helix domain-containing protein [Dehalococcoidales bacterium]
MDTFAELLTIYIRRAGITDTELARTIGVSRQTIFRWREGLTGRPNKREDILAIAQKLRLSPDERDSLLLAGGFRPDDSIPVTVEAPLADTSVPHVTETPGPDIPVTREGYETGKGIGIRSHFSGVPRRLWYLAAGLAVALLAVWLVIINTGDDGTGTNVVSGNQTVSDSSSTLTVEPAAAGESLVLIAEFTGDTADNAGLMADYIRREGTGSRIPGLRVETINGTVSRQEQAEAYLKEKNAVCVIYGSCSQEKVTVNICLGKDVAYSLYIDRDDRVTLQAASLVALAEVCIADGNPDLAFSFLTKARNLLTDSGVVSESISEKIEELISSISTN